MAKLKNPLLSLGATGGLAKALSFVRRRKQNIVEKMPQPEDAKSLAQLSWRHMYLKAVALWNALSASDKLDWESLARPHHMTGYAYFLSQALKPNPGLYLPLQGGTMSGDIDMAKNRILKLPAPTDPQEAARLADVGGVTTFVALTDTPGNYVGDALKLVRVNAGQTALEFVTPTVGAQLFIAETEVWDGSANSPIVWTDLDLSGVVGSNPALILLKVLYNGIKTIAFRKNGDTDQFYSANQNVGCAIGDFGWFHAVFLVATDSSGKIEWITETANPNYTIDIIAYIK